MDKWNQGESQLNPNQNTCLGRIHFKSFRQKRSLTFKLVVVWVEVATRDRISKGEHKWFFHEYESNIIFRVSQLVQWTVTDDPPGDRGVIQGIGILHYIHREYARISSSQKPSLQVWNYFLWTALCNAIGNLPAWIRLIQTDKWTIRRKVWAASLKTIRWADCKVTASMRVSAAHIELAKCQVIRSMPGDCLLQMMIKKNYISRAERRSLPTSNNSKWSICQKPLERAWSFSDWTSVVRSGKL